MKKIVCVALIVVLCFTFMMPAFAAVAGFMPSVPSKPGPGFNGDPAPGGGKVVGVVRDPEGNVVAEIIYKDDKLVIIGGENGEDIFHDGEIGEDHECIVVTPLSEAETSAKIPPEAKEELLRVYEELLENDMKIMNIEGLDDSIDLVVRDLFDVSALCDGLKEYLAKEGTTITLCFDLGFKPGDYVQAVVYVDGQWKLVDAVNIAEDGSKTCLTFSEICPVAILVPAEITAAPDTGDAIASQLGLWVAVAGCSLAAIVVLAMIQHKRKAHN